MRDGRREKEGGREGEREGAGGGGGREREERDLHTLVCKPRGSPLRLLFLWVRAQMEEASVLPLASSPEWGIWSWTRFLVT